MGFTVLRVFLLSASISLLLLPGFSAKFEPSSNETAYDGRYSKFKIVVEETEAENIVLTGNASPDASVSGDDGDGGNVAGIMVTLSESGLTYAKEMLVNQLLEEITPLMLPDIKTHTDSPLGRVDMEISHIELSGANVSYSDVDLWKTGITVFAGDINARIRLHWYFKFMSMFVPFPLSDRGWADVEVTV